MEGYSDENPDEFCIELLDQGNPIELREWLYDDKSTLGELQSNAESIALVRTAYEAGAKSIFGIDIEEDDEYGSNTGELVLELPDDQSCREKIISWAAPIAHEQGFDAYFDVGQKYLFIKLD